MRLLDSITIIKPGICVQLHPLRASSRDLQKCNSQARERQFSPVLMCFTHGVNTFVCVRMHSGSLYLVSMGTVFKQMVIDLVRGENQYLVHIVDGPSHNLSPLLEVNLSGVPGETNILQLPPSQLTVGKGQSSWE